MDIEQNLATYLGARSSTARYASFDYCFNYFQSYREEGRVAALAGGPNMQVSCLQLGFYLASWGMLRGSTVLLHKNVRYFAPVIDVIAAVPKALWQSDANDYSDEVRELILDTRRAIRGAFPDGASDILVTKLMLGVFGCVPAFDTNFMKGSGISTFGSAALQRVAAFYEENAEVIERHRELTLDFDTGTTTDRRYSRAKVIDMIFFVEGAS